MAPGTGGEEADPALDTVQRLFPGRVIAFQPFEEAEADDEAGDEDVAAPEAGGNDPDDGETRAEA